MRVVASVQRKRVDAPAVHHLAQFGGFGFELCSLGGDRHGFRCHARLKRQVHADAILNVHLHRTGNGLLESLLLDGDAVTADPERAGDILSLMIGGEGQLGAAIDVHHGHFGVRDHCASAIAHQAYNGASILLCPQRRGEANGHEEKEGRENLSGVETDGHGEPPELESKLRGLLCNITNYYFYLRLMAFVNWDHSRSEAPEKCPCKSSPWPGRGPLVESGSRSFHTPPHRSAVPAECDIERLPLAVVRFVPL